MLVKHKLEFSVPLTKEQIEMLEALKDRPVVPDEDCPELTDEQLRIMVEARRIRQERKKKKKEASDQKES
jgi:hypothetical protein